MVAHTPVAASHVDLATRKLALPRYESARVDGLAGRVIAAAIHRVPPLMIMIELRRKRPLTELTCMANVRVGP